MASHAVFNLQTETYRKCDVTVLVFPTPRVTCRHNNVNHFPRSLTSFMDDPLIYNLASDLLLHYFAKFEC